MSDRQCIETDCAGPVIAKDRCGKHYAHWKRTGPDAPQCSAEGCTRPQYAKGYCQRDYARLQRTGSPHKPDVCSEGHEFTADNTYTNPRTGKRRCNICHADWKVARVAPPCSIEDCSEPVKARTWCGRHYRNWENCGDPLGLPVTEEDRHQPGERWLPVPGWEGLYDVSDHGRVWSTRSRRLLTLTVGTYGYFQVALCRNRTTPGGKQVTLPVHRIEARAFLGPKPRGLGVRHLDGNSQNNMLANLLYGTQLQNMHDAIEHGTHRSRVAIAMVAERGECVNGHGYLPGSFYFNRAGSKICRACDNEKAERCRQRRKARRLAV